MPVDNKALISKVDKMKAVLEAAKKVGEKIKAEREAKGESGKAEPSPTP